MRQTRPLANSIYVSLLAIGIVFSAGISLGKTSHSGSQGSAKDFEMDSEIDDLEKALNEPPSKKTSSETKPKLGPKLSLPPKEKEDAKDPSGLDSISSQALQLKKQGKIKDATDLLWKNVTKINHSGLLLLGQMHLQLKQADQLLKVSGLMIAKSETDHEAYWMQGKAHQMKGNLKAATESFTKSTEAKKDFLPANLDLAQIYQDNKNYYEARLIFQDLIELSGQQTQFLTHLCEIDALDGVNDGALENCRKAIMKDPTIASNHVYIGIVYKQTGEDEKAKKQLQKVAQDFPKSSLAQKTYAEYLREKKNFLDAEKYYSKCVSIDSKDDLCFAGLGLSSYQLQLYEQSYSAFKKACFLGGRKHAVSVREALNEIRRNKIAAWSSKFEELAGQCAVQ